MQTQAHCRPLALLQGIQSHQPSGAGLFHRALCQGPGFVHKATNTLIQGSSYRTLFTGLVLQGSGTGLSSECIYQALGVWAVQLSLEIQKFLARRCGKPSPAPMRESRWCRSMRMQIFDYQTPS